MEERIYNIISDIIKNSRFITKEELTEIFNIFIKINGLENYVTDLDFDLDKKTLITDPHYNSNSKTIYYYYDYYYDMVSKFESLPLRILLVKTLIHELMHAMQDKKMDYIVESNNKKNINPYPSSFESFASYLLVNSIIFNTQFAKRDILYKKRLKDYEGKNIIEKYDSFYNQYHDIYPTERFADLDSILYLRRILFKYEKEDYYINMYHHIISYFFYEELFEGYKLENDNLLAPTEMFFEKLGTTEEQKAIKNIIYLINKQPFPKTKMLYLGLNIDKESFIKLQNYYKDINITPLDTASDIQKKLLKQNKKI